MIYPSFLPLDRWTFNLVKGPIRRSRRVWKIDSKKAHTPEKEWW